MPVANSPVLFFARAPPAHAHAPALHNRAWWPLTRAPCAPHTKKKSHGATPLPPQNGVPRAGRARGAAPQARLLHPADGAVPGVRALSLFARARLGGMVAGGTMRLGGRRCGGARGAPVGRGAHTHTGRPLCSIDSLLRPSPFPALFPTPTASTPRSTWPTSGPWCVGNGIRGRVMGWVGQDGARAGPSTVKNARARWPARALSRSRSRPAPSSFRPLRPPPLASRLPAAPPRPAHKPVAGVSGGAGAVSERGGDRGARAKGWGAGQIGPGGGGARRRSNTPPPERGRCLDLPARSLSTSPLPALPPLSPRLRACTASSSRSC